MTELSDVASVLGAVDTLTRRLSRGDWGDGNGAAYVPFHATRTEILLAMLVCNISRVTKALDTPQITIEPLTGTPASNSAPATKPRPNSRSSTTLSPWVYQLSPAAGSLLLILILSQLDPAFPPDWARLSPVIGFGVLLVGVILLLILKWALDR